MKKPRLQWMSEQELKWFCYQYEEKFRYIKNHTDGRASIYMQHINMIETALHLVADAGMYEPLKNHVTNQNMPYERLGAVPMGRRQFYRLRSRFYSTLARLRE